MRTATPSPAEARFRRRTARHARGLHERLDILRDHIRKNRELIELHAADAYRVDQYQHNIRVLKTRLRVAIADLRRAPNPELPAIVISYDAPQTIRAASAIAGIPVCGVPGQAAIFGRRMSRRAQAIRTGASA